MVQILASEKPYSLKSYLLLLPLQTDVFSISNRYPLEHQEMQTMSEFTDQPVRTTALILRFETYRNTHSHANQREVYQSQTGSNG